MKDVGAQWSSMASEEKQAWNDKASALKAAAQAQQEDHSA